MLAVDFDSVSQLARYTLKLAHGREVTFGRTHIMGVVNLAPDSFSKQGRHVCPSAAVEYACQLVEEGADFIDLGAEPTNPSLDPNISADLELRRLLPVIEKLSQLTDVPISIDTSKAEVIEAVIPAGAHLINDVRALRMDGALDAVIKTNTAVCLMHMLHPFGVQAGDEITYQGKDNLNQVRQFLFSRMDACLSAGMEANQLIIDPGIGYGSFGKSSAQNCEILRSVKYFHEINLPVLIGASRKTFIGDLLDQPADERMPGSLSCAVAASLQGAQVIRVHDVKASVDAIRMVNSILQEGVLTC